ncbi:MAG: zinc-dependent metalloprotease family protein, partial [Thermoguttaceae bacterium]
MSRIALIPTRRNHPATRPTGLKPRRLAVEPLESRQLLSVMVAQPVTSAVIEGYEPQVVQPRIELASGAILSAAAPVVPSLSSNSNAAGKLYLDFDGHFEASWGAYSNITTPVFSLDADTTTFSSTELATINTIWAQVAEDYAPFNIDVTTVMPASFADKEGLRVAIGGSSSWYGSAGGVAYLNTWTNYIVNTVYVFPQQLANTAKYIGEAVSHESGHAFGLYHQSTYDASGTKTAEYSTGSGDWAPIMGNSYYNARTTWHNGTSSLGSTTYQDDMALLSSTTNAFGYRADDHGGTSSP